VAALGYDDRKQRLVAYRGYLARRMHELAELVHRENGKPHADAILEITLAIDHLARAGNHARKVLGSRRVPAGMLAAGNAVVLKPAEHPATIGAWLAAAWRAAVPDAADASQVVTGFGGTGSSPCSWRARRQGRDDRGRRRRRAFPRLHRSGVRIVLTTPAINDLKSRNPTPRSFAARHARRRGAATSTGPYRYSFGN
jgi:hypothetical protein